MDMWEVACVAGAREKKWAQEKTRAREALGKKKWAQEKRARGRHTRLPRARFFLGPFFFLAPPSRAFFLAPIFFSLAPATQAMWDVY